MPLSVAFAINLIESGDIANYSCLAALWSAADALRRFVPTNPEVVDAVATRVEAENDPYIQQRLASILAELRAMRK